MSKGIGGVFGGILGGVLQSFDAEEVLAQVATQATAAVARGPLSQCFQKMKVEGRKALAAKARKFADALEEGRCDDAAGVAADVIDDIKLR